jgi:mono/diheme cytochrome c family protein
MKQIVKQLFSLLFLGCCLLTPKGLLAQNLSSAKKLFTSRCSQCHNLSQAYDNDSLLPSSWKATVKEMQGKSESNISDSEAEVIYEFLVYDTTKRRGKELNKEMQSLSKDQQETEQAEIDRIKQLFS